MNLKKYPELIPVIDWWEKDGKQTLIYLIVAAIAVGGWYGVKNYRAAQKAAAADAVTSAYTTEELEEAVSKFGSSDSKGALRIRLAKSYYDAARYDEAIKIYEELAANPPEGFADIPAVGKAQCLEGLGRFAEAQAAFDAFAEANPKNYLTLTAKLGAIRCLAQAEKKAEALKRIDALKADKSLDAMDKSRIETTEDLVKRWTKPAPEAPVAPKAAEPAKK